MNTFTIDHPTGEQYEMDWHNDSQPPSNGQLSDILAAHTGLPPLSPADTGERSPAGMPGAPPDVLMQAAVQTGNPSSDLHLASNTHAAAPTQYGVSGKHSTSPQSGQYTIDDLSTNPEWGGDYRKVILNAAHQYGLDPRALQAIIYKETKGNPSVVNHNPNGTIDYGMMQVNSGTRDPNSYNWRDPVTGIYAGAHVFAGKLKQAHGNYREAFRRYNGAGPRAERYGHAVYGYYTGLGGGNP